VYRIGNNEADVAVDAGAFIESFARLFASVGLNCDNFVVSESYSRGNVVLDAGVSVGVRSDEFSR